MHEAGVIVVTGVNEQIHTIILDPGCDAYRDNKATVNFAKTGQSDRPLALARR